MGLFSFFSKQNNTKTTSKDFSLIFTRDTLMGILNSSDTMMMFFSKKDGWIGANHIFYKKLGYKDFSDFADKYSSVRELFVSESEDIFTQDDKSWLDYLKKYKKRGHDVKLYDTQDNLLDISLQCTKSQANIIYILEFKDETKLNLAKQQTQEAEELKTKFLSNVGHEFRTPMSGILGFLELLDQTQLNKKQKEYIQLIDRSSKNLISNIETLLDLSQMQSGLLTIDNIDFGIISKMEALIYNHTLIARDKGIKVLSFIDPKLPETINADGKKIEQIMHSLIQNAIKFTDRGGRVVVEVKLLKRELNGNCSIGFSVKDNGKGISKDELVTITESFTASGQSDRRLGVGLTLANGLIELLDSELKIQTKEGEGSYFNFVLDFKTSKGQTYKMMPKKKVKVLLLDKTKIDEANFLSIYLRSFAIDVVKSNTLNEKIYDGIEELYIVANQNDSSWMLKLGTFAKQVPVSILLDDGEKFQTKLTHTVDSAIELPLFPSNISKHLYSLHNIDLKEKIQEKVLLRDQVHALVVEDNLINQRLIQIILQEYKILVSTASNGNEAIEMCQKEPYDIVFMDIEMPEKNGIAATKDIKQKVTLNAKTPIVALTALAMQGDRERILKEGLDDYLSKPLTRDKLEKILKKYLKVTLV